MRLLFIIALLASYFSSFSQDIIITNDGNRIESKVEEIGVDEVIYKKFYNLNGPIYHLKKNDILKIIFENGTFENFEDEILNIDETKNIIKIYIDEFAYERSGRSSIRIEFEEDFLRFYYIDPSGKNKDSKKFLYDLSGKCEFHNISKRRNNIAYINVYLPRLLKNPENTWSNGYKLVMRVKGQENAEIILNALKHYHEILNNKSESSGKF